MSDKTKKRGRRTLSQAMRRTNRVVTYLNEEELRRMNHLSHRMLMEDSALLREALFRMEREDR